MIQENAMRFEEKARREDQRRNRKHQLNDRMIRERKKKMK